MPSIIKCPKCEKFILEINASPMPIKYGQKKYDGAAYSCPLCNTILGVGFDPITMINEIVKGIKRH
jgi:hypothetical protein